MAGLVRTSKSARAPVCLVPVGLATTTPILSFPLVRPCLFRASAATHRSVHTLSLYPHHSRHKSCTPIFFSVSTTHPHTHRLQQQHTFSLFLFLMFPHVFFLLPLFPSTYLRKSQLLHTIFDGLFWLFLIIRGHHPPLPPQHPPTISRLRLFQAFLTRRAHALGHPPTSYPDTRSPPLEVATHIRHFYIFLLLTDSTNAKTNVHNPQVHAFTYRSTYAQVCTPSR